MSGNDTYSLELVGGRLVSYHASDADTLHLYDPSNLAAGEATLATGWSVEGYRIAWDGTCMRRVDTTGATPLPLDLD
ncbi:MAG: hypothetical protein HN348_29665, partial [Proteobacteria bacterium]|nr:hypothetical protein [Pseudomonadota bacterium]